MYKSLWFKDQVGKIASNCCNVRYEGSGVNDTSIGQMFYLKQISKAADALYNQLREKVDHKDAVDKKIVASDKFFAVEASTRSGGKKIDPDLMLAKLTDLVQATAVAAGAELSNQQARNQAAQIIADCTVYGKDATVISVVEKSDGN